MLTRLDSSAYLDSCVVSSAPYSDEDIIEATNEKLGSTPLINSKDEDEHNDTLVNIPTEITRRQANEYINQLRLFFQAKDYDTSIQLQKLLDLESDINIVQQKQSTIPEFFKLL